ncbi:MAG: ankyrin repeat domain-containing protein [Acidimicrobiia bacterium]|nr:ankyrin repeat domain-containing protein [Acidimicrobiia bacterium]
MVGEDDIALLLLSRGANPNGLDDRQISPLSLVAISGRLDMAQALLDAGADPDSGSSGGRTIVSPLGGAAGAGEVEMTALLIDAGAGPDADVNSDDGMRLLPHASMYGYTDAMRLLLDAGADPNGGYDRRANTAGPLLIAVLGGRIEAVRMLLDAGANPQSALLDGVRPAMLTQDREILDLLGW